MTFSLTPSDGPTPCYAYDYPQPFQPLGAPAAPPPYNASSPWNIPGPMSPAGVNPFQPAPEVRFVCGSLEGSLHRIQSLTSFGTGHSGRADRRGRRGKSHPPRSTHASRKRSRHDLQQSYSAPVTIPFPEPQYYPPIDYNPPSPYPGSPLISGGYGAPPASASGISTAPTSGRGLTSDEISIQPEHCTFLVDAVKEMGLCSRIFSTWVEQIDRLELGKKVKEEANIGSMITGLADNAAKMLTASRDILKSYKALARLMDRRLSLIAHSRQGDDLFTPSLPSSQMQGHNNFQLLALDVHVHSTEISACVEKMQDRLHNLHDAVLRTHEKYSFRKKFWGWVCTVFRFIAQGLFLGSSLVSLAQPVGTVGSAVLSVGSGLTSIVASVCEKIKEAYDEEEKGLNEVLKLLQGKISKSMRVAQTALEKFQAVHIVFRQHNRVASGRASVYLSSVEAARARTNWHKAAGLLELKDNPLFY